MNAEFADPIPDSWEEVSLAELLIALNTGKRPKGGVQGINEGIPSIGGEHLNSCGSFKLDNIKFVPVHFAKTIERARLQIGDILVVKDGATTGKTSYVNSDFPFEYAVVNEHIFICRCVEQISNKYLFYFLFSQIGKKRILTDFRGAAQGGISVAFINKVLVPIAPYNEQRRIVTKIEELKARSQQVKEALETIPPLLEQFSQSVLAAAFRSDLTADWREKNPDVEWKTITLEEVIKNKPRNGYSPKPVDYPTKVKSISLSATTSGKFKAKYFKYIDEEIAKDSYLWLTPGDILIQRSNTLDYVGTCAIYDGAFGEFIYPDLIMKVQVREEKVIPEFVYYALSTKKTRLYYRKNATGTAGNMPKINQQIVMNTPIEVPPIEEQKEIVCRLESFLEATDQIAQQYQEAKTYLDQLDQSILAKAFRGELVPQDPNDEPASILLERIRAERANREAEAKAAKKSTGKTNGRWSRKAQQQDSESNNKG